MFDVLTLWLIIWVVKNAAMDVSCAVTGKPNPRYELKKARAKAAGQPAPATPRYGGRDWFADLVSDGLQAQTERRRAKADAQRRQAEQQQALADEDDTDAAGGRPATRPDPVGNGSQPTTDASTDAVHARGEDCGELQCWDCADKHRAGTSNTYKIPAGSPLATPCPTCGTPINGIRRFHGADPDELIQQHCLRCGWLPRDATPAAAATQTSDPGAGGAPGPEQHHQHVPRPAAPADPGHLALVIPFPIKPQEENVSTDIHSEVIGLDQSIAYARSLAVFAGEHGQAGNEGYIGHLSSAKVEGVTLQSAHEMQEAFTNAAAAAEAHAAELEKQRAVQEAYDAAPDAGDKEFQTEGR